MGSSDYTYVDSDRPEVRREIPVRSGRLLDVGCGQGAFGGALRREWADGEVWGLETNPWAADRAAARLDRVIVGSFPDALPAGEVFDLITFNDILEHLTDPWSGLETARSYLAPGGLVVASIPNVRHLDVVIGLALKGRWDYAESGVLDRTHLRFFTRRTAIALFESSGFAVKSVVPVNLDCSRHRVVSRALAALRLATEFRALQYVLVAEVC